ncbi:MAG: N-acetylneuraminate synthase [Candidatus Rokubacteria bacterium]|nr:N-acetylneuraminate synthase [Candidatus Rokubacteria bacterium]
MIAPLELSGRQIGPGRPCFLIAEAGVNHNGDVALAKRLIEAAAEAGADAVKFQTFRSERLVSPTARKAAYQAAATGAQESQLDMIRRLELPAEAYSDLKRHCEARGVLFLSTPFDEESADLLDTLGVAAFKIPSGEVTNPVLLAHVGRKGKPVILSTGMSTLEEVAAAVATLRQAGAQGIAVLHCVSSYPADPADANLRAMATLAEACHVPVGYSDHTPGIEVALAAAALGACVIEKHLTLDRTLPGPDHRASLEPAQFSALVRGVRIIESALGDGRKRPRPSEADTAAVARRSLVAARDLPAGATLTEDALAILRPGTGLAPSLRARVVGRRAKVAIPAGTPLTWEMVG